MRFCCHVFNLEQTFESLILKRSTKVDRKQFPSRVSQVSIFLHFTHRWLLRKQLHVSFSVCTFGATYFCSTDLSMVCNPQNRLIPFVSPFENDFPVVPVYGTSQVALVVKNPARQWRRQRDMSSNPGSGRFPGGGHGNSLQDSCLENPMDRGAWRAMVHRVAKIQTRLNRLSMHISLYPSKKRKNTGSES